MIRQQYKPGTVTEMETVLITLKALGLKASGCNNDDNHQLANVWFRNYPCLIINGKDIGGNSNARAGDDIKTHDTLSSFLTAITIQKKSESVKLNPSYTAIVSAEGIDVGCQTFTLEAFDKLAQAVAQVRG